MACTLTAVPYGAAAVTSRRNLVRNPGPTTTTLDASWSGWGGGGAGSVAAYQPGVQMVGDVGVYLPTSVEAYWAQSTAASGPGGLLIDVPAGSLTPGQSYIASAYMASSPGGLSVYASIVWRNSSGTQLSVTAGTPVVATTAALGYRRVSVTGVAPAGASGALVALYASAALTAGQAIGATAVLLEQGSTLLPYFDGSTRAPVGARDTWEGTAGASVSRRSTRAVNAARSVTVDLVLDYQADRDAATILHEVIGRRDPLVAVGPLKTRSGVLDIWCATEAIAHSVVDLYAHAGVVMLRDTEHPDLDMYHVVTSVGAAAQSQATNPRRWGVQVAYTEVYATGELW